MSINVYAWPPVSVTGAEWTEVAPVQRSRSLITGADYISAAQRKRRMATLIVPGRGKNAMGAGYIEVLKRYLAGIHAVRLYSYPVNWFIPDIEDKSRRQAVPLEWSDGGVPLEWTDEGIQQLWYDGVLLYGTTGTSGGFPSITVIGLPPNRLVARPGEFITIFETEEEETTVMIADAARSNGSGTAVIRLLENPGSFTAKRVNLGTSDTGVFRPVEYPRAVQPPSGIWSYTWEFREVFADEVGGFTELNPWS